MRILVSGALGHIGSQFIHSLKPGEFEEVVLLDNLMTQRYCSLFDLPQGVPFRFREVDICNDDLEPYFEGMDAVVHLAAITNAAASFEIQEQVERVNYLGTLNVAQACLKTGSRLFFPSTTSVYGSQDEAVDETCPIEDLKPQSPYAASKLEAEQALQRMGAGDGLRSVICRLGTIFGTSIGMRFHTAVNKFVWQACMGEPLTVWTTAMQQKRPYLELDDAVAAIKFILKTDLFDNDVYNVVTANATVADLIEIIGKAVPDVRITYVDQAIMNQLSYTVANDKFRARGFTFHGSLERGIHDTIRLIRGVRPACCPE